MTQTLAADYLVVGSGAMGMAFTDELMKRKPEANIIMIDKHAKPGGHWNDAYPFVFLHQPALFYGVNSEQLGSGGVELASGAEVLAYFERVLNKLTATGRLRYFPMCEYQGDGKFCSTIEPDLDFQVNVSNKIVDATYMKVIVPSMREAPFPVAPEMNIVPLNELPKVSRPRSGYVVIGAGKTGMDAVLFLLNQRVDPDHITWVVSNDAWFLNRPNIYPQHLTRVLKTQLAGITEANTEEEIFLNLEAHGILLRLDKDVWPTKYRCATVNTEELEQLRWVNNIVRMGRVERIDADKIVLEQGSIPTDANKLHIDCTANGLSRQPSVPIFQGNQITLQSVLTCQQVFSASLIGYVESRYDDDTQKNELCQPVPHPEVNHDFLTNTQIDTKNALTWVSQFAWWLLNSRLFYAAHVPKLKFMWGMLDARKLQAAADAKLEEILNQASSRSD
ncbi:MAG: NAD(P)/FAD-dependent oxidoreductase [Pseudomonadota bacterium]